MHRYQFRGILGVACMLAGVGADALPPPRPREPEPTLEEIEALAKRCVDAGIDILALGERSGGDPREFVRLATIELAARDLATAGVLDVAGARDVPALARDLRREVDAARLERLLHPAGQCTCGVGGFGGTCDWSVMDRRRMLREARHVRRTERDQDEPRRDVVLASMSESERKAKHRKARAKVKARRGW